MPTFIVRVMGQEEAPLDVEGGCGATVGTLLESARRSFKLKNSTEQLEVRHAGIPLDSGLSLGVLRCDGVVLEVERREGAPFLPRLVPYDEEADARCRSPSPVPLEVLPQEDDETHLTSTSPSASASSLEAPVEAAPCSGLAACDVELLDVFPPNPDKKKKKKKKKPQPKKRVDPSALPDDDSDTYRAVVRCFKDGVGRKGKHKQPLSVEEAFVQGKLDDVPAADLSLFLQARGLSGNGSRKALVSRVQRFGPVIVNPTRFSEVQSFPAF